MRTGRVLWAISITALVVSIVLISIRAYYVAIALVIGALLFGHRELWSLLTRRTLPPFDERIRENINKAVRNTLIFLALVLALLMLPFATILIDEPATANVLGGLLLSGGVIYVLSYLFYDRAEPKLNERGLKMLKTFLLVAGISLTVFILSVFLHNALSALFNVEEPVFFVVAVFIAPLGFVTGLIGSLVVFLQGLLTKSP